MPAPQSCFWLCTLWAPAGLTQEQAADWYWARANEAQHATEQQSASAGERLCQLAGGTHLPEINYNRLALFLLSEVFRGFCGQLELGPHPADGTDRYHIQFYCVTAANGRCTVTGLKRLLPDEWNTLHGEVCTENERSLQCVEEYCNDPAKPDGTACQFVDMFRFGIFPSGKPGAEKLEDIKDQLLNGTFKNLQDVIEKSGLELDTISRHQKFFDALWEIYGRGRSGEQRPYGFILIGPSGTGKSFWWKMGGLKAALEAKGIDTSGMDIRDGGRDVYKFNLTAGGYVTFVTKQMAGKIICIIEEFNGQFPKDLFKQILDYGQVQLQGKGFFMNLDAWIFVFTSNHEIRQWWPNAKEKNPEAWERDMEAVERRIKEFCEFPNYKLYRRSWLLEQRLIQQGGLRIVGPTRRITPEPMETDAPRAPSPSPMEDDEWAGMSPYSRHQWMEHEEEVEFEQEHLPDSDAYDSDGDSRM